MQALQLRSLEGNPGILPVKKGDAYLQVDNWTIIKVIKLDPLHTDLKLITSEYDTFAKLLAQNKTYPQEFVALKTHVEYLRFITIEKYRQLVPQRFSRGLINPLGSLIKIVTGNLDHADALKYDKLTTQLSDNQVIVSNKITLISKMLDGVINNTETMNSNVFTLGNKIEKIEIMFRELATQKNWVFSTYLLGLFNLFISNFRTIFIKISEIETALALSKVSVLHQSIVNSTELLFHLKSISKYGNLLYLPTDSNLVKLEESISVKSYIKKNQITFIMDIPLITNITYNYFKMYSLPIYHERENLTLTIFPEHPFLLAKGISYLPIAQPCRALAAGDQFLCTDNNRALYAESTCIEQLMEYENTSRCVQQSILMEDIKLQQINDANWIIYSRLRTTLIEKREDDITRHPIFGTYMMTLNEPCHVEVAGIKIHYHNTYVMHEDVEQIPIIKLPLLQMHSSPKLSGAHALNMKEVNLDELKYMAYALKQSEFVNSAKSDSVFTSDCLFYVSICVLMLSLILSIFLLLRKKCTLMFSRNHRENLKTNKPDNFALEGGDVMCVPHPSVLD